MKKAFIGATFSLLLVVIAAFSWYVFFWRRSRIRGRFRRTDD
ncbi:hypothetical protein [Geomicrobium sp. JCM 19055]|nr:hypothetical protein [Geomicrobium sp. JCM 19055]